MDLDEPLRAKALRLKEESLAKGYNGPDFVAVLDALEKPLRERMARVAAMPRVKFLCGKEWGYGPWCRAFGVMWDKDPLPDEGAYIYRKRLVLHLTFHVSLERHLTSSEAKLSGSPLTP